MKLNEEQQYVVDKVKDLDNRFKDTQKIAKAYYDRVAKFDKTFTRKMNARDDKLKKRMGAIETTLVELRASVLKLQSERKITVDAIGKNLNDK